MVVVKQEDNAGLHMEKNYLWQLQQEFLRRDWIIFNQPPLSLALNIHDACVFLMMAKQVSAEQTVLFGSRVLQGKELHKTIMKVWNNEDNICAMSLAFIHHTQVVNSILHYDGGNDCMYKKKGLHFGIRKIFINDEDGQGVLMIQIAPEADHETHRSSNE